MGVHVGDSRPEFGPAVLGSEKIQLAREVRAENTKQILKENCQEFCGVPGNSGGKTFILQ